jgi:hypothetical protein
MKKLSILAFFLTTLFVSISFSEAALYDRGSGLIYDDALDITWIQNANYMGVTMTWDDAVGWAGGLVFQGYDDWRLPYSDFCTGSDCTESEMGHLYYMDGITSSGSGIFTDVRPSIYWSGVDDSNDSSQAMRFNFKYGTQGASSKTTTKYAWAVRNGDSVPAVVPEPVSSALFLTGGSILGFRRFYKIRK